MGSGYRGSSSKSNYSYVRCFQLVENCFNPFNSSADALSGSSAVAPKIGDIMYSDKSYGSADDYDGSKTAVGVVTAVSADGTSATIMNLKDLRFSSNNSVDNFNPDDPYTGSVGYTYHTTNAKYAEDITEIPNYDSNKLFTGIKTGGVINVTNTVSDSAPVVNSGSSLVDVQYAKQFNAILGQYDSLIQDASYKGINLLKSQNLSIIFNENRSSKLDIIGVDASSGGLGLNEAQWKITEDVNSSIQELTAAINSIRAQMSYLGTNFEIISNREDFTKNLINILNEGADKLVLADMNEESANMLALQTRQQLAVNSLSLVSLADQSVLNLF